MNEPIYTVTTERIYARLPEFYRTLDAQNQYAFKTYISSFGDVLHEIEQLVARIQYIPPEDQTDFNESLDALYTYTRPPGVETSKYGYAPVGSTSDLLDGRTADDEWLLYLGQLVGADLRHVHDMDARRDAVIRNILGFRAGSRQALEDATKNVLTGDKFVRIYPHRNGAGNSISSIGTQWDILIVTKPSETPPGSAVIDEILRKNAKPAGVVLHHIVYGAIWSDIQTMFPSWSTLETTGKTWVNIETGNADLLTP